MTNAEVRAALARCGLTNEHITSQMRVYLVVRMQRFAYVNSMQNKLQCTCIRRTNESFGHVAKEELSRAYVSSKELSF